MDTHMTAHFEDRMPMAVIARQDGVEWVMKPEPSRTLHQLAFSSTTCKLDVEQLSTHPSLFNNKHKRQRVCHTKTCHGYPRTRTL